MASMWLRHSRWVVNRGFRAWLCCEAGGRAVLYALLLFAMLSLDHAPLHGSACDKRTTSSLALLIRLKLSRYSSSSLRKFFSRSNAFSCLVCTGSCLVSLP
jgi:hypothetical protein